MFLNFFASAFVRTTFFVNGFIQSVNPLFDRFQRLFAMNNSQTFIQRILPEIILINTSYFFVRQDVLQTMEKAEVRFLSRL